MALTQDLASLATQNAERIPTAAQAVMTQAADEVAQLGLEDQSFKTGDRLPKFTLTNAVGNPVAIADLLKQGPVVIAFYRGGWCPYCNLELRALQQALPAIAAEGAQLVAIAPETPDHSLSTQEKNELTFEVLSDIGNQVARELGLVFTLPKSLLPIYQSFGIDIAAHNGDKSFELPVPATYVVTPEGEIVHHFVNIDYKQREDPENILAVLKRLRVTA